MDFASIINRLADHEVYGSNLSKDEIGKLRVELRLIMSPSDIDQLIRQRIDTIHLRRQKLVNNVRTILESVWGDILSIQDVELLCTGRETNIFADRICLEMVNVCTFYANGNLNISLSDEWADTNYHLTCDLNASTMIEIFNIVESEPADLDIALAQYIQPVAAAA